MVLDKKEKNINNDDIINTIWLSVREAAKMGGVNNKTIRRSISAKTIKYKVVNNRYFIDFLTVIKLLQANTKLNNKLNQFGIGQYVDKWKKMK